MVEILVTIIDRDIKMSEVNTTARKSLRRLRRFLNVDELIETLTSVAERQERARAARLLGVVGGLQPTECDALIGVHRSASLFSPMTAGSARVPHCVTCDHPALPATLFDG